MLSNKTKLVLPIVFGSDYITFVRDFSNGIFNNSQIGRKVIFRNSINQNFKTEIKDIIDYINGDDHFTEVTFDRILIKKSDNSEYLKLKELLESLQFVAEK